MPIAQRRAAARYHDRFDARSTVLIADTPADVDAARDGVAVATGGTSIGDLRDAGAALVLPALTDTAAVVSGVRTVAGIP